MDQENVKENPPSPSPVNSGPPALDPGNSDPAEWTKEASEEQLAEAQRRLEEEWGA